MKNSVWLFALVLALPGVLAAVNLSHNETYAFNYTTVINATEVNATEDFFCAQDNVCQAVQLNISLQPGENRTYTNGTCSAVATCAYMNVTNSTPPTCIISKTLDPGENYSSVGGACDVNIKVTGQQLQSEQVRYRVNVTVDKQPGKNGSISIDGKQYVISDSPEGFFVAYQTDVMCPTTFNFDASSDAANLLKVCSSFVPELAKHLQTTLTYCEDSARTHIDDLKEGGAQLSECQKNYAESQAAKAAAEEQMKVSARNIEMASLDKRAAEDHATMLQVWLVIVSGIAILLLFLLIALFLSMRRSR